MHFCVTIIICLGAILQETGKFTNKIPETTLFEYKMQQQQLQAFTKNINKNTKIHMKHTQPDANDNDDDNSRT